MKRRVVRRMMRKTTKRITRGSKSLSEWEYGRRNRHASTKRDDDYSEGAGGVLVWEQPVSKMLSFDGQNVEALRP